MAGTLAKLNVLLNLDTSDFDRGIGHAGDASDSLSSKLGGLASRGIGMLADAAKVGVVALGGATAAAVGFGLKTAASMETAQIGFETMLGSADKAHKFLGDLQSFAAKTPFEFPELQTAASSLISVGFETKSVIPIMTTLGNVTAGMGTGSEGIKRATVALQQMSAAGRITGEDLNQLRDAGIPVFDLLAAATGKSKEEVAALAQAGKLGKTEMEQLFKALESGKGLERFNGLMEKQSASLSGMWSTLKDNITMGLATAVKPLAGMLGDVMPAVSDKAAGALKYLGQASSEFFDAFRSFMSSGEWEAHGPFERAGVSVARFARGVRFLIDLFRSGDADAGGFAEIVDYMFGNTGKLIDPVMGVVGVLKDLWTVISVGVLPVFKDLTGALPSFITPLGLARDALGFVADHAKALQPIIAMLLGGFIAFRTVTTIIQAVTAAQAALNVVMAMNPIGLLVIAVAALAAGFVYLWRNSETFRDTLTGAWAAVVAAVGAAWEWIKGAGASIAAAFSAAVDWITALPGKIVDAAVSARDAIGSFLGNLPGYLGTIVGTVIATFITAELALVRFWFELPGKIVNALVAAAPVVWGWFIQLPGVIMSLLSGATGWLAATGANLIVGLIHGINAVLPFLWNFFIGLPRNLWDILGNGAEILVHVGKNLVIGLWNGLVSMKDWLWSNVKAFFGGMLGPIGKALGLGSPSKITAQYGQWVVEGLANGMLSSEGMLAGVADQVARTALPNVGDAAGGVATGGASIGGAMAGVGGSAAEVVLEVDGYRLGKVLVPGVRAGLADVERRNVNTAVTT